MTLVDEEIELAVVVLQRRSPHAAAVAHLVAGEVVTSLYRELLQGLCTIFPVDKVLRLEDCGTREEVHRCADHVICRTYAYNIGIREVSTHDGVGESSCADIADGYTLEIRLREVLGVVVGIPFPACT